jgi:hypothetical protein
MAIQESLHCNLRNIFVVYGGYNVYYENIHSVATVPWLLLLGNETDEFDSMHVKAKINTFSEFSFLIQTICIYTYVLSLITF